MLGAEEAGEDDDSDDQELENQIKKANVHTIDVAKNEKKYDFLSFPEPNPNHLKNI